MFRKTGFFRPFCFTLAIFSVLLAGRGKVFAVPDETTSRIDRAIAEIDAEQKENPVEGRDYDSIRELLNLRKKIESLDSKRNELLSKMSVDDRCLVSGLSDIFSGFRILDKNIWDVLDRTFGFDAGFGNYIQNMGKIFKLPDEVSKLQESGKSKVLILDKDGKVLFESVLRKKEKEAFKKRFSKYTLKDAVVQFLKSKNSDLDLDELLKEDGLVIAVKVDNVFYCFKFDASKDGKSFFKKSVISSVSSS